MKFILLITLFMLGCTTGEKFSRIELGMTKNQVVRELGSHDQAMQLNDKEAYIYKDRLLSGWSLDKADYFVVFDNEGKVIERDRGPVTEVRRNTGAFLQDIGNALKGPSVTNCTSTKDYFGNIQTRCTGE